MLVKLVLLINFLGAFSLDLKSAWNSMFLIPFVIFFKKGFLGHISTFSNLEAERAKTAPEIKKLIK
jgi:fluoride ion exporter CrcB/FEX